MVSVNNHNRLQKLGNSKPSRKSSEFKIVTLLQSFKSGKIVEFLIEIGCKSLLMVNQGKAEIGLKISERD